MPGPASGIMAKGKDVLDEKDGRKAQIDAISRDYILEPHLGKCPTLGLLVDRPMRSLRLS